MIPIKIEATNPSNIGGYKNTLNYTSLQLRTHDKPEKGSYQDWTRDKLTENKHIFLEDINLTEDELVASCVSSILQNDKYPYISYWVDNEVDSGADLEANEAELYSLIRNRFIPLAQKQYAGKTVREISIQSLIDSWEKELTQLEVSLSHQYGSGVIEK